MMSGGVYLATWMRYEDEDIDASDLRVLTLGGICRLGLSPPLFTITIDDGR